MKEEDMHRIYDRLQKSHTSTEQKHGHFIGSHAEHQYLTEKFMAFIYRLIDDKVIDCASFEDIQNKWNNF